MANMLRFECSSGKSQVEEDDSSSLNSIYCSVWSACFSSPDKKSSIGFASAIQWLFFAGGKADADRIG